jgi:release factor glutamine methyltransferase
VNALEAVRAAERELGAAGVPEPRTDAELLVAHVLGRRRSELYGGGCEVDDAAMRRLRPLLDRRFAREPLQYVLGEWGFRRLTLSLDKRVLVPRPETEILVERCLFLLREHAEPHVLDVGVGSGAIALALADEHSGACVTGVDASTGAIAVARANARRSGLAARVELVVSDLLRGLAGPYDLVVSNPPYVHADEVEALDPEVREWEPRSALVAPGLTEAIAREARGVLRPGGWLALECADGQASRVAELLRSVGYEEITVTPDLNGTDRVVDGRVRA